MDKILGDIFAFPGVGVKLCGKEKEVYRDFEYIYKPLFEEASDLSGIDIFKRFFSDNNIKFSATADRVFTLTYSFATAQVYESFGIKPDANAVYSFGVYPALAASKALSFEDALLAMTMAEETVFEKVQRNNQNFGMVIIVGLLKEDAENLLQKVEFKSLLKVNENNDTCILVSGIKTELVEYAKQALEFDAISADLINTEIPYHHNKILSGTDKILRKKLEILNWQTPNISIISTIDQSNLSTIEELKDFTANNISTPINWYNTMNAISRFGTQRVFESGHGISLTQNNRFTGFDLEYINIKNFRRKLKSEI